MKSCCNHETIERIMQSRIEWKSEEIQAELTAATGRMYSESNVTRRLREMPNVHVRRDHETGRWLYRLVRSSAQDTPICPQIVPPLNDHPLTNTQVAGTVGKSRMGEILSLLD